MDINAYGLEVAIDLVNCRDPEKMLEPSVKKYLWDVCDLVKMEPVKLHSWASDDPAPHIFGVSAVLFIRTSSITIHAQPKLKMVCINLFSCKDFEPAIVTGFSAEYFCGLVQGYNTLTRGVGCG